METIIIDVGVYTPLKVDLTNYDFTGIEKLVLTIKNSVKEDEPLIEREFTEAIIHDVYITPEESKKLILGAKYDFNIIATDGKRYKASDTGKVDLRECVGTCNE